MIKAAHNILIVDDSATTRAMIKRVIRMTDLPVISFYEAPDGSKAMELLAAHVDSDAIDLVLTDLNMPVMDGLEMNRQIRSSERLRSITVVVITARPDDQATDQLRRSQVQGWLPKPFTPEMVRDVVERALSTPIGNGGAHV